MHQSAPAGGAGWTALFMCCHQGAGTSYLRACTQNGVKCCCQMKSPRARHSLKNLCENLCFHSVEYLGSESSLVPIVRAIGFHLSSSVAQDFHSRKIFSLETAFHFVLFY